MNKTVFEGVATALITPFTDDSRNVDYKAYEKLIEFQIANSTDAVVVSGTTGESPVLSRDEKISLFRTAVKCTDNKIPVIAGTGSNNTEEAVKKSNDAEKEGVNGLLIVTPYYNKCSQDGIIKHYSFIANRVSTPVIVYNVPSRTGVTISPETYKALSEHKNIVAVKEASSDMSSFIKAKELCGDSIDFYSGNDDLTVVAMAHGAKGVISVASNIIPDIMHRITVYCRKNNFKAAAEIHKKYLKLMNSMFCDINPIPVKYACSKIFNSNNTLRLPLTELSADKSVKIDSMLSEYNLI